MQKTFLGCMALQSGGAMRRKAPEVAPYFRDFLKLTGRTRLILWPEIQPAAAERALIRLA
eukprot:361389-Chlamydomonas_euryale.AAC.4